VACAAGHGVVAGKLFVPEEDFSEDSFGLSDLILGWNWNRSKWRGRRRWQLRDRVELNESGREEEKCGCSAKSMNKSRVFREWCNSQLEFSILNSHCITSIETLKTIVFGFGVTVTKLFLRKNVIDIYGLLPQW
jgi:hypothetical protein